MLSKYSHEESLAHANTEHMHTHKVSFKFSELRTKSERNQTNFSGKKAVLAISVGQEYHEGGKFLATIDLINKYPFERCDIVLCDTLQRHNHYARLGEENAYLFAKEAGELWLDRNAHALNRLNVSHNIIRWDTWLFHEEYNEARELVEQCYHENQDYKNAIHTNVQAFLDRASLINPDTDQEALFNHVLNYIIEECPIAMPLWAKMGYDFIIYPKAVSPAMAKTRDLFVVDQFGDKCEWIYLRFRKK
jgi:tRNA-dependent cyclodipeptide synthase